jgi:transposase InsO family protein
LKTEYYDRHHWATKAEARHRVGSWIEDRYNRRRRHSAIAMLSPVDFEQSLAAQDPAA